MSDFYQLIQSLTNDPVVNYALHKIVDLLYFLGQSSIAGLIVLACTEYLRKKRDLIAFQKHCMFLLLEVRKHAILLTEMIKNESNTSEEIIKFNTTEWTTSKLNFTKIPLDQLKEIASYYEIIELINLNSKNNIYHLKYVLTLSIKIQYLLLAYSDNKNKKKHRNLYLKYKLQSESNETINSL